MRKYSFSRTITVDGNKETFTAVEWDAFDEAMKAVDKGIYNRMLELKSAKKSTAKSKTTPNVDSAAGRV